jgi:hypothetical protein
MSRTPLVHPGIWSILDTLKIPRRGLHAFRHTHSSLLVEGSAPVSVAQAQLRLRIQAVSGYVPAAIAWPRRAAESLVAAPHRDQMAWPAVARPHPRDRRAHVFHQFGDVESAQAPLDRLSNLEEGLTRAYGEEGHHRTWSSSSVPRVPLLVRQTEGVLCRGRNEDL